MFDYSASKSFLYNEMVSEYKKCFRINGANFCLNVRYFHFDTSNFKAASRFDGEQYSKLILNLKRVSRG